MTERDVIVTAIQFGEEVINIQYAERRKQSEHGGILESATYELEFIEDDVEELQQNAVDLVDTIQRLVRDPPKRKKSGVKWAKDIADTLEEEPDDDED